MLSENYVVVETPAWGALQQALAVGDIEAARLIATEAPVSGDYHVIREDDVLAAQGLYAYAATIRTAVEFTQASGLSVMLQETEDALNDLADDLMETGACWQSHQQANATAQRSDWGTLES